MVGGQFSMMAMLNYINSNSIILFQLTCFQGIYWQIEAFLNYYWLSVFYFQHIRKQPKKTAPLA